MSFDRTRFTMDLDLDVPVTEELIFGRVRSGAVGIRTGSHDDWYREGDFYLGGRPEQPRTSLVRGGHHEQFLLDPCLIDGIVAPGRRSRGPVRFIGSTPHSEKAAALWTATWTFVRDTVLAGPEVVDAPLVGATSTRLLASAAVSAFPNTAFVDPTIEDRHDAHPTALRRAIAFIDENAHRDISVADIAAAALVTIRSVQLAFRRHLATTPTAYLRRVRLKEAHRDLAAADPAGTTVTAVAARWGFASQSRFAANYRAAFGCPPSATLHVT